MATSKLLKPTNVTISIPAFTDQPDQRVNSNCIDKEADAINSLSDQIGTINSNIGKVLNYGWYWTVPTNEGARAVYVSVPHPYGKKPTSVSTYGVSSPGHYTTTATVSSIDDTFTNFAVARADPGQYMQMKITYTY